MQIFVRLLNGETKVLQLNQGESLQQLRNKIAFNWGISHFKLVHNGSILQGLGIEEIQSNSTLFMTAGLDGGKKKKKRKPHTTKKKTKHKHRKIKLSVLNLYSVGNGKVQYDRKSCANCGPGIFMGKHWDRYSCGACDLTMKMDIQTIKINEEAMKKKQAQLMLKRKAAQKQAAQKATTGGKKKGKKDKKDKKKK